MRRIGIVFFAIFVLATVFAGCGEKEKVPKTKDDEKAAPSASLLPQDAPRFSSDEPFFPNTEKSSSATTTVKATVATSSAVVTTTTAPVSTTESAPALKNEGLELPDHNWNERNGDASF